LFQSLENHSCDSVGNGNYWGKIKWGIKTKGEIG
jgi:hypothetical protein